MRQSALGRSAAFVVAAVLAYLPGSFAPATATNALPELSKAIASDDIYDNKFQSLEPEKKTYIQPWSGYCPAFTLPNKAIEANLSCQAFNIKASGLYDGIEVYGNKWVEMACEEARLAAAKGQLPFGSVIVQIDDQTGRVIRYWRDYAHVVEWKDPTAHAELTVIRDACKELGVLNLGKIEKSDSNLLLPQTGATSHCDLYASTESCPMCYTAVGRAGINSLIFAATRFDSAVQGAEFPIDRDYHQMTLPYAKRSIHVYQATVPNSLDSYNLYKRTHALDNSIPK
jgi:tRNA(Arg) A34 adenosine deaminase TadA